MAKRKASQEGGSHFVVKGFRDINNWENEFKAGQDVSDLPKDRLDLLVEKGLVTNDPEVIASLPKVDDADDSTDTETDENADNSETE